MHLHPLPELVQLAPFKNQTDVLLFFSKAYHLIDNHRLLFASLFTGDLTSTVQVLLPIIPPPAIHSSTLT